MSRSTRSALARSRRRRSIALRRAVTVIQAPGFAGTPSAPQRRDRGGERVLNRVLGELEVAELADQGRDDRALLLAKGTLDRRGRIGADYDAPHIGRTSTEP